MPLRHALLTPLRWSASRVSGAAEELAARGFVPTLRGRTLALNRKRLLALRGRHEGRRCFIIGNGPSLRMADLDRLKGEISIGANKIYLAFGQTAWRPTYVAVLDELIAANNREALRRLPMMKFVGSQAAPFLPPDERCVVVKSLPNPRDPPGNELAAFSDDLVKGAYGGYSVLYLALQAAAYMGMSKIYMIGLDFEFKIPAQAAASALVAGQALVASGECNHFSPDYRPAGELWTYPRLEDQRKAFLCARQRFEKAGGFLLNASRHTKLDALETIDFDQIDPPPGLT